MLHGKRRVACCLGLVLLALGCGPSSGRVARKDAPDILVVVIDSLRADHVGAWGYSRDTTPFLDKWAKGAALYRKAYTHGTHTRIAMASLFTGTFPTVHRIREVNLKQDQGPSDALVEGLTTWAESLRDAGYDTWALVSNPHISDDFGFTQGFGHFWLTSSNYGATIKDKLFEDLKARSAESAAKPLFLYLHFMDVHSPYQPPPPWDTYFPSPPGHLVYANWFHDVNANDLAYSMARYDGGIRSLDETLSQLIPRWEATGTRPKAAVVLSDHGEEFMEHGGLGHGNSVFEELAHVVFVVKGPAIAPGVYDEPVCHADAHRLVLDWAGATVPEIARGRQRADWGRLPPPLYTESKEWVGYRSGQRLLVVNRAHPRRRSYYDRATDPAELKPLEDHETLHELNREMERLIGNDNAIADSLNAPRRKVANKETAERLKALGYVDAH